MERLRHIKPDWWQKVIIKNQVLIMRKNFHQCLIRATVGVLESTKFIS